MQTDNLITQLGTQSVFATGVTPTARLMQMKSTSLRAQTEVGIPDNQGQMGPGDNVVTLGHEGAVRFEQYGLYEDIAYWLENIFGTAAPTGAGPYVRTGSAPLTAEPTTPRLLTLMHGQSGASNAVRAVGVMLNQLTLKGETRGYVMVNGQGGAMQVEAGQTLAALSSRTVNHVLGRHTALYIDAAGGTIGTTAIPATAFSWQLDIKAPRDLLTHINSGVADAYSTRRYTAQLQLHLEWNATTTPYITEMLSTTAPHQRQIRLLMTDSPRILQLNFAGANDGKVEFFKSQNGRASFDATYDSYNNAALGNYLTYSLTNGVAVLA